MAGWSTSDKFLYRYQGCTSVWPQRRRFSQTRLWAFNLAMLRKRDHSRRLCEAACLSVPATEQVLPLTLDTGWCNAVGILGAATAIRGGITMYEIHA